MENERPQTSNYVFIVLMLIVYYICHINKVILLRTLTPIMIHNFKLKIKTLILQNLDKSSKIWQKMLKNLSQKFTDESFAKYIGTS